MIAFYRSTHDDQGNPKPLTAEMYYHKEAGIIHLVDAVYGVSLETLLIRVKDYNQQFPDAPMKEDVADILETLATMIRVDMIRVRVS